MSDFLSMKKAVANFDVLNKLHNLELPSELYTKIAEMYASTNYAMKSISPKRTIGAIAYYICHNNENFRSIREIAHLIDVDTLYLKNEVNKLLKKNSLTLTRLTLHDYVRVFAKRLKMSENAITIANKYADLYLQSNHFQSCDPTGIAAALLYLAGFETDEKQSQHGLADVTGATEVTIRTRASEIKQIKSGQKLLRIKKVIKESTQSSPYLIINASTIKWEADQHQLQIDKAQCLQIAQLCNAIALHCHNMRKSLVSKNSLIHASIYAFICVTKSPEEAQKLIHIIEINQEDIPIAIQIAKETIK